MKQSAPKHLQEQFRLGREYLVVAGSQAFLAESATVAGKDGFDHFVAIYLPSVWKSFQTLAEGKSQFRKAEVAKAAGVSPSTIDAWNLRGIIQPSIRKSAGAGGRPQLFSISDCFAAALCGCLRRQGVSIEVAGKAALYVSQGDVAGVSQ
ncbi:MAG: MerR family transcriptional regulator [Planctomycetes bacterium]|nr:MerR family transcriptional regulator [Planctomycetota bacterium]